MKWTIPAKTFFIGEYAALADRGSIILTTKPCFELTLSEESPGLYGIHPDSPAGRWWRRAGHANFGLHWFDPYQNCGGLGASSAQFLGAFWASSYLKHQTPTHRAILEAYWQNAWDGQGMRPSGYDVIAQSLSGCVAIERLGGRIECFSWPFDHLAFIIVHTGHKLATHHHLQETTLPKEEVHQLDELVSQAISAFQLVENDQLVDAINQYHHALGVMNRVAPHTQMLITKLETIPGILALKGCGAMGADVMLCITTSESRRAIEMQLVNMNLKILATNDSVSGVGNV